MKPKEVLDHFNSKTLYKSDKTITNILNNDLESSYNKISSKTNKSLDIKNNIERQINNYSENNKNTTKNSNNNKDLDNSLIHLVKEKSTPNFQYSSSNLTFSSKANSPIKVRQNLDKYIYSTNSKINLETRSNFTNDNSILNANNKENNLNDSNNLNNSNKKNYNNLNNSAINILNQINSTEDIKNNEIREKKNSQLIQKFSNIMSFSKSTFPFKNNKSEIKSDNSKIKVNPSHYSNNNINNNTNIKSSNNINPNNMNHDYFTYNYNKIFMDSSTDYDEKTALIIEDEKINQRFVSDILINKGFVCVVADTVTVAINWLFTFNKINRHFDVIFLDMYLNDDQTGVDFLKIRQELKLIDDSLIVVFTSSDDINIVKECTKFNVFNYIKKPVSAIQLEYEIIHLDEHIRKSQCPIKRYKNIKKIGHGGTGEVFLIRDRETNNLFAMKKVYVGNTGRHQESTYHLNLKSPTILELLTSQIIEDYVYMIMEYADKGTITDWIKSQKDYMLMTYGKDMSSNNDNSFNKSSIILDEYVDLQDKMHNVNGFNIKNNNQGHRYNFSQVKPISKTSSKSSKINYKPDVDLILLWMTELFIGLHTLHKKSLIHRDIKTDNLFLCTNKTNPSNLILKIGDLGIAKVTEKNAYTICGTYHYMAPEILRMEVYDNKVDIWAAGIVLYEMVTLEKPFQGTTDSIRDQVLLKSNFIFPQSIDHRLQLLLMNTMNWEKEERFSTKQLLTLDFIQEQIYYILQNNLFEIEEEILMDIQFDKIDYSSGKLSRKIQDDDDSSGNSEDDSKFRSENINNFANSKNPNNKIALIKTGKVKRKVSHKPSLSFNPNNLDISKFKDSDTLNDLMSNKNMSLFNNVNEISNNNIISLNKEYVLGNNINNTGNLNNLDIDKNAESTIFYKQKHSSNNNVINSKLYKEYNIKTSNKNLNNISNNNDECININDKIKHNNLINSKFQKQDNTDAVGYFKRQKSFEIKPKSTLNRIKNKNQIKEFFHKNQSIYKLKKSFINGIINSLIIQLNISDWISSDKFTEELKQIKDPNKNKQLTFISSNEFVTTGNNILISSKHLDLTTVDFLNITSNGFIVALNHKDNTIKNDKKIYYKFNLFKDYNVNNSELTNNDLNYNDKLNDFDALNITSKALKQAINIFENMKNEFDKINRLNIENIISYYIYFDFIVSIIQFKYIDLQELKKQNRNICNAIILNIYQIMYLHQIINLELNYEIIKFKINSIKKSLDKNSFNPLVSIGNIFSSFKSSNYIFNFFNFFLSAFTENHDNSISNNNLNNGKNNNNNYFNQNNSSSFNTLELNDNGFNLFLALFGLDNYNNYYSHYFNNEIQYNIGGITMSISDLKNIIIRQNKVPLKSYFKLSYDKDFRSHLIYFENEDYLRLLLFICLDPPTKSILQGKASLNGNNNNMNNYTGYSNNTAYNELILPIFTVFSENIILEINSYMKNFSNTYFKIKDLEIYLPKCIHRYLIDFNSDKIEMIKTLYYYSNQKEYSLIQLLNLINEDQFQFIFY